MTDLSNWNSYFGSGLKSEGEFTIYSAIFTTDASYMNGEQYVLLLVGMDEDGADSQEMLSVGADWESLDGGATLSHPRKSGTINRNSTYGKWCAYAAEACEKSGTNYIMDKNPLNASTWINTKWALKEKLANNAFKTRSGEEVAARYRLFPDEFLGLDADDGSVGQPGVVSPPPVVAQVPSKPPSAPSARTRLAAAASAPQAASANGATPASSTDQLQVMAQTMEYSEFINAVMAMDDVVADDDLVEQLLDQSPSGFYSSARG